MLKNRVQGDPSATVLVFADCGGDVLKRLETTRAATSAFPGHVIAREGDPLDAVCIIVGEGVADVVIGGRTVTTMRRGDSFVEMSRVDGKPRSATIIARQRTRLFELDAQGLTDVLPLFPAVSRHMLRDLSTSVRRTRVFDGDSELPVAVE